MNVFLKTKNTSLAVLCMMMSNMCIAVDFITITAPTNSSTVAGNPLVVTGASSGVNSAVQFIVNSVNIGNVTTDGSGNFSHSFASVASGSYSLTVNLLASDNITILATASVSFTVSTPAIDILAPSDGGFLFSNPVTISGSSSLASTTVNVSINGSLAATTTTDGSGNWSVSATTGLYGTQPVLAELKVSGVTVASSTITITIMTINRVIKGIVPTSGSGSGTGYTYTNGLLSTTITYVPAFSTAPVIAAIAQNGLGISAVGITSSSTTSVTLGFATGATSIHFVATSFS